MFLVAPIVSVRQIYAFIFIRCKIYALKTYELLYIIYMILFQSTKGPHSPFYLINLIMSKNSFSPVAGRSGEITFVFLLTLSRKGEEGNI